jgi:hypothetical protein
MAPCHLCKDTGKHRLMHGSFIAGHDEWKECMCTKPLSPEEALDAIVFRTMTEAQVVDRIVADFLGPTDTAEDYRRRMNLPGRERVEAYIARLVAAYGSKLGGLTRNKLASKVMTRMAARQRKRADAHWKAYYSAGEHQST